MSVLPDRISRRVAAVVALVAWVAAVLYLIVGSYTRWPVLLGSVALVSLVIVASWYMVSRRGTTRVVAGLTATAALAVFVVVMVLSESLRVLAVPLALATVSVAAAGYALRRGVSPGSLQRAEPAREPVLLINPKSGGGKAERTKLTDLCVQAGIEPVVLLPGDDLTQLAEGAIAAGADLIGMAGGDGSQALVASVASRHDIPFVVVPAGTRNHFALDLGIDRDDVPGSLAAFSDGVDVVIDLAEVNGRIFVNNAAMGVYARIVQSADYRDAKLQTVATLLPDLIGPEAEPCDLLYTLPSGEQREAGQLLLVSNNPYELHHLRGGGRRSRLDTGALGAASVTVSTAADVEALSAFELTGRLDQYHGWEEWTASVIDVHSPRPVEIGVDGEALVMEPPLHFVCHPSALTVRLPRATVARTGAGIPVRLSDPRTIVALWQTAFGPRS